MRCTPRLDKPLDLLVTADLSQPTAGEPLGSGAGQRFAADGLGLHIDYEMLSTVTEIQPDLDFDLLVNTN